MGDSSAGRRTAAKTKSSSWSFTHLLSKYFYTKIFMHEEIKCKWIPHPPLQNRYLISSMLQDPNTLISVLGVQCVHMLERWINCLAELYNEIIQRLLSKLSYFYIYQRWSPCVIQFQAIITGMIIHVTKLSV